VPPLLGVLSITVRYPVSYKASCGGTKHPDPPHTRLLREQTAAPSLDHPSDDKILKLEQCPCG
jgi:hypothetical protein